MGTTRAQRLKAAKKHARDKRIRRDANLRRNAPAPKFRLDVFIDGSWRFGVKLLKDRDAVKAHVEDTEKRREAGEQIAQGRVVGLASGEVVAEIAGSKPKGMLPDKISDGPVANQEVRA